MKSILSDDPRFIIEPRDVSGEKGQDAQLVCLVDGNPTPTYTWFKNGDMRHVSLFFVAFVAFLLPRDNGVLHIL